MKFLHKILYRILMLAGLSLPMVSCVQEAFDECGPVKSSSVEGDHYVAIRIQTPDGSLSTRAGGFSDSENNAKDEEFEHAIGNNNYAIFFDVGGDFVYAEKLLKSNPDLSHGELEDYEDDDPHLESIYKVKYKVPEDKEIDLEKKDEILGFCLVVLNAGAMSSEIEKLSGEDSKASVDDFLSIPWSNNVDPYRIGRDGDFFTMTNSTYIDSENGVMNAVPFKVKTVHDGKAEDEFDWSGEKWDDDEVITVYVERLVSKYSVGFTGFSKDENIYDPIKTEQNQQKIRIFEEIDKDGIPQFNSDHTYRVKITGFAMNALEKESYLFKKAESAYYYNNCNDEDNFRSYWGEDLNYNGTYPWQFREALDRFKEQSPIPYYDKLYTDSQNNGNILRNYSYDEIVEISSPYTGYFPENTYNFEELTDADYDDRVNVLAGTHIIVTAELLTDFDTKGIYEPLDVYRDRLGNFYRTEEDCFRTLVSRLNNALDSQYEMKFTSYDWKLGGPFDEGEGEDHKLIAYTRGKYKLYYKGEELTDEVITQIFTEANANGKDVLEEALLKDGDGKRFMWLDDFSIQDEEGKILKIVDRLDYDQYGNDDPKYRESNEEITSNEIKSLIYEWIGAVEHFTDGKMYYFIPIQHDKNSDIYGNVRNHWYNFVVDGVNDIGTSVDITDNPIVPINVTKINRLNFYIDLLPWHEIEMGVPILP